MADIVAVVAAVAAIVAVPGAWVTYRTLRVASGEGRFREILKTLPEIHLELGRAERASTAVASDERDVPLLVQPGWIPDVPLTLDAVNVRLTRTSRNEDVSRSRRKAAKVLNGLMGSGQSSYSDALTRIGGFSHFFNGTIYRPTSINSERGQLRICVTRGRYFDYLDTSEILSFESAISHTVTRFSGRRGRYRRYLRDPFNLHQRVASMGINTLTIRRAEDRATFLMHRRAPDRVVVAQQLHVVPAGEFTPCDGTYEAFTRDLSIWRNILREYAEELLGVEEAQGESGRWIDYDTESPYRELNEALRSGKLSVYVLGVGLDPLNWKPELLTVCIIDDDCFDEVFTGLVRKNDEGVLIVGQDHVGLPFDRSTVARYADGVETGFAAQGCLKLTWRHRATLGLTVA